MISNTPRDQPPQVATQEPENPIESDFGIDSWLDDIADHWHKSVKKIKKTNAPGKLGKKNIKQLCYGLDANLIAKVQPLVDRVMTTIKSDDAIEQLVGLAESAAATADAFSNANLESFAPEVSDSVEESDLALVTALSALLVASRLRDVALRGNDQQFERITRSLMTLQRSVVNQPESVLVYQWLAIELPMTVANQLYALKPFRKEGKAASKRFVEVARNLLDSDGWPSSECLRPFGPLAASWTRSIRLAEACKFKLGSSFYAQIEWVAEQFVRLHGPGRRLLFASDLDAKSKKSFVQFVMDLDTDGRAHKLAKASGLLPDTKMRKTKSTKPLGEPTCISEWAGSAILKSSWSPKSPQVAIDFSSPHCLVEIAAKQRLVSGRLAIEIRLDGAPVELPREGFEVVCDMVDKDVNYLELELHTEDLTVHRQLLLSKKDNFLFFADSIANNGSGEVDYRLNIPLAKEINVIRENGTRELYLNRKGTGIQSLVLPLSLPEWTAERCRGLLSSERDEYRDVDVLNLERTVQLPEGGGALYCPVFFDLDPLRSRLKRTWRSLTVAENLGIVSPEIAAAYRVQVNEEQWIFYRALREIGNRTFMGQNFSGDFFAAKFAGDGRVKELVEVQ